MAEVIKCVWRSGPRKALQGVVGIVGVTTMVAMLIWKKEVLFYLSVYATLGLLVWIWTREADRRAGREREEAAAAERADSRERLFTIVLAQVEALRELLNAKGLVSAEEWAQAGVRKEREMATTYIDAAGAANPEGRLIEDMRRRGWR